jgi:hypothetical protein
MAWTAPITWVGGQVPTAALLNAQLRDNLLETMPAKATTEGQIFVGNGANSITTRIPDAKMVSTQESTSSTSYTNLATSGPSITLAHGIYAIIFWSAMFSNNTADADTYMSWDMSGSNVRGASDIWAVRQDGVAGGNSWKVGGVDIISTLTPGTTTFTAKYRVASGTGTFSDRFIGVIPL